MPGRDSISLTNLSHKMPQTNDALPKMNEYGLGSILKGVIPAIFRRESRKKNWFRKFSIWFVEDKTVWRVVLCIEPDARQKTSGMTIFHR